MREPDSHGVQTPEQSVPVDSGFVAELCQENRRVSVLIWVVLPYCCFGLCVTGCFWSYWRQDGSSPRHEDRAQTIGSQLVGWGIWAVVAARVGTMLSYRPLPSTPLNGVILVVEIIGAAAASSGVVMLSTPRITGIRNKPSAGLLDRLTLPLLLAGALSGAAVFCGPFSIVDADGPAQTLFPWFRSLFTSHPDAALMVNAPALYQIRALVVLVVIAVWPYTHVGGVITRWLRLLVPSGSTRHATDLTPAVRAARRR